MDAQHAAQPDPHEEACRHLSALADGEAAGAELSAAFDAWRDDAQARRRWQAYALIGDVMRSDDLAQDPAHDAAFLARLRGRLAEEPVVLAPAPVAPLARVAPPAPVAQRRRWATPLAMAAGVLTVAGVTVMMRGMGTLDTAAPAATLAQATQLPLQVQQVALAPALSRPADAASPVGGVLLRDPQLDRYLDEHRRHARGPVLSPQADDSVRQVGMVAR